MWSCHPNKNRKIKNKGISVQREAAEHWKINNSIYSQLYHYCSKTASKNPKGLVDK
jgi:hypothetical protein